MTEIRPVEIEVDANALWNFVPDALIAVDPNGRIAAANPAALQMFGTDTEDLVGRPVEVLVDEPARADHSRERHRWTRLPTPRLMGARPTFPARTLDGRRIDVQVALNPIQIDGRRLTIAVIRDITIDAAARREQAKARDEVVQRLFGLGMSLRSLVSTLGTNEAAGRIEAVVEGISDVVDVLDCDHHGLPGSSSLDDGRVCGDAVSNSQRK